MKKYFRIYLQLMVQIPMLRAQEEKPLNLLKGIGDLLNINGF